MTMLSGNHHFCILKTNESLYDVHRENWNTNFPSSTRSC